jgi:AcrR family transcriptional regulator
VNQAIAARPVAPALDGDSTTARLIGAAAEVFAERGYDGAGVAEIARRAGLTTGAIYSRFSGKAELLAEAVRACSADEFDQLFAEHAFRGGAADILGTVGTHLVTRAPDPGHALLLEAFVAARRDPEVAAVLREHLAERASRMAALIDASKANGEIDPAVDTAAVVHFAHAVGLGFLLYEAIGARNPEPGPWHDVISRVLSSIVPHGLDDRLASPAPFHPTPTPTPTPTPERSHPDGQ